MVLPVSSTCRTFSSLISRSNMRWIACTRNTKRSLPIVRFAYYTLPNRPLVTTA